MWRKTIVFVICLFAVAIGLEKAKASTKAKWELGLSYYDFQVPHYLGSNHYHKYNLVLPSFTYRFDNLELGRDSKFYFFDSEILEIDIALSGGFPVFSEEEGADAPDKASEPDAVIPQFDNYTRRGMPDLPIVGSAGIRFRFFLSDHLILSAPFFHGAKIESGFEHAGNSYETRIRLEFFDRDSDHDFGLIARNLYADEKYNDRYYSVPQSEALSDRPEYDADAGLVATIYGLSFKFQITERLSFSGSYYTNNMEKSVIKDSPLVVSKKSKNYFFGISYSLFLSDQIVNIP